MVKVRHRGRLIYFHKNTAPTDAEVEQAFEIAHNVAFRKAGNYAPGALEAADAVAGTDIPPAYAEVYPTVKTAGDFNEVLNPTAPKKGKAKEKPPADPPSNPPTIPPGQVPNWNPQ